MSVRIVVSVTELTNMDVKDRYVVEGIGESFFRKFDSVESRFREQRERTARLARSIAWSLAGKDSLPIAPFLASRATALSFTR